MTGRGFLGLIAIAALIVAVCCGTTWLAATNPSDHPPTDPNRPWTTPASPNR